jgi:hypothetical protein
MKLCLFCKEFEFAESDSCGSECTPANEALIRCGKDVWYIKCGNASERDYRKGLEKAEK